MERNFEINPEKALLYRQSKAKRLKAKVCKGRKSRLMTKKYLNIVCKGHPASRMKSQNVQSKKDYGPWYQTMYSKERASQRGYHTKGIDRPQRQRLKFVKPLGTHPRPRTAVLSSKNQSLVKTIPQMMKAASRAADEAARRMVEMATPQKEERRVKLRRSEQAAGTPLKVSCWVRFNSIPG